MTTTKHTSDQDIETHIVHTEAGEMHITRTPGKGNRKAKVTVLLEQPDNIVRGQVGGFINFLREHAVVGLAVGFIIGQQAQALIKQLVDSFVTPFINLWVGQGLMNRKISFYGDQSTIDFTWGKFLYALINFLFVLLFIYVIIKVLRLDRLDKPKADADKKKAKK